MDRTPHTSPTARRLLEDARVDLAILDDEVALVAWLLDELVTAGDAVAREAAALRGDHPDPLTTLLADGDHVGALGTSTRWVADLVTALRELGHELDWSL